MSRCPAPFALPCPRCHVSDTLLEVVFTGKKIMILAGYCPTCHSVWHSVYQRQTGEVTHYPVKFYIWKPTSPDDTQENIHEDTSC